MKQEELNALLTEIEKLHKRNELSKTVGPDYFEPGMMENLEQFDGEYTPEAGTFLLRFEAKGTRYDGRTEQIEKVKVHDKVQIVRDQENSHNSNNFRILTSKGRPLCSSTCLKKRTMACDEFMPRDENILSTEFFNSGAILALTVSVLVANMGFLHTLLR